MPRQFNSYSGTVLGFLRAALSYARYPTHESESAQVTRIASVKPHPISVPLKDPVWTAHEELTSSSVIVVEVRTDDGLSGYGQIHGSPMKAICAWVEQFGEIVRGMVRSEEERARVA